MCSQAEIVLLDDVLSALDVHTSRWIVDKCFSGDLVRGRTLILITHNVTMAGPLAQHVVSIRSDGIISSRPTIGETLSRDSKLRAEITDENMVIEMAGEAIDAPAMLKEGQPVSGKLVADEEVALGHVSWAARKSWYFGFMSQPILICPVTVSLFSSNMGGALVYLLWFQSLTWIYILP